MAKKKVQPRRVPRAAEPRMYGDGKPSAQLKTAEGTAVASQTNGTATRSATSSGTARPAAQAFRPPVSTTTDYTYVLKDLRRLAILSAATFAVLIALGLIVG